jgi:hypothetical protein
VYDSYSMFVDASVFCLVISANMQFLVEIIGYFSFVRGGVYCFNRSGALIDSASLVICGMVSTT